MERNQLAVDFHEVARFNRVIDDSRSSFSKAYHPFLDCIKAFKVSDTQEISMLRIRHPDSKLNAALFSGLSFCHRLILTFSQASCNFIISLLTQLDNSSYKKCIANMSDSKIANTIRYIGSNPDLNPSDTLLSGSSSEGFFYSLLGEARCLNGQKLINAGCATSQLATLPLFVGNAKRKHHPPRSLHRLERIESSCSAISSTRQRGNSPDCVIGRRKPSRDLDGCKRLIASPAISRNCWQRRCEANGMREAYHRWEVSGGWGRMQEMAFGQL